MKFKVHVTGKTRKCRVDFLIWSDDYQIVEQIRRYSYKNSFQFRVEVIEE